MLLHPPIHARDIWLSKHFNTKVGLAYGWRLSLEKSLIIHCTNLTGGWQYWCIFFPCWKSLILSKVFSAYTGQDTSDFWHTYWNTAVIGAWLGWATPVPQFNFVCLALQAGNSEKYWVNCLDTWVAAIAFTTEASSLAKPTIVNDLARSVLVVQLGMWCTCFALWPFCTLPAPPSAL